MVQFNHGKSEEARKLSRFAAQTSRHGARRQRARSAEEEAEIIYIHEVPVRIEGTTCTFSFRGVNWTKRIPGVASEKTRWHLLQRAQQTIEDIYAGKIKK